MITELRSLANLGVVVLVVAGTSVSASGSNNGANSKNNGKVSICHVVPKKHYNVISVSSNALTAHLAHGDLVIGADVDENCEPLGEPFCMLAVYPGEDCCEDELYELNYVPSSGKVTGNGVYFPGPLVGTITPSGSAADSIFASGSSFEFVMQYDGLQDLQWSGVGYSSDETGLFVGTWGWDEISIYNPEPIPDGAPIGGPAGYQFYEGTCEANGF